MVTAWRDLTIGTPAGHGVVSKGGTYYLPLANSPDGNRPEIWAIDVADGKVTAEDRVPQEGRRPTRPPVLLGNLVFHDGQLISQSPLDVSRLPADRAEEAGDGQAASRPTRTTRSASSPAASSTWTTASSPPPSPTSRRPPKNNPPEDVQPPRCGDKLYAAYTELLRKRLRRRRVVPGRVQGPDEPSRWTPKTRSEKQQQIDDAVPPQGGCTSSSWPKRPRDAGPARRGVRPLPRRSPPSATASSCSRCPTSRRADAAGRVGPRPDRGR